MGFCNRHRPYVRRPHCPIRPCVRETVDPYQRSAGRALLCMGEHGEALSNSRPSTAAHFSLVSRAACHLRCSNVCLSFFLLVSYFPSTSHTTSGSVLHLTRSRRVDTVEQQVSYRSSLNILQRVGPALQSRQSRGSLTRFSSAARSPRQQTCSARSAKRLLSAPLTGYRHQRSGDSIVNFSHGVNTVPQQQRQPPVHIILSFGRAFFDFSLSTVTPF